MKLIIATLSLAFASVRGSSLRAGANFKGNNSNGKMLDSEIILKGTIGEPTAEDLDFIGKAFVASYNNVHWEVGHYMTGEHAVDFKGPDSFLCRHCPDDDSMGSATSPAAVFEVRTPVGFLCRHCPDDDAMGTESLLMTAVTEDCAGLCKKQAAMELGVAFCEKIRSSKNSKYLSSAKDCDIQFDVNNELNQNDKNHHVGNGSSSNAVATIDSTIILKGAGAGETTKDEQAILAKAFVSAYNDVHWKENHYLTDAEIAFTASTGTDPNGFLCRHCPDDDAMGGGAASETNTLVFDIVTPVEAFLCRHCPDDDAMGSEFDAESLKSNTYDKKALEVAFCSKIQNSVSDKLSSTKSCSLAVESIIGLVGSATAY